MQAILLFIGSKPELIQQYSSAQLDLVKVRNLLLAKGLGLRYRAAMTWSRTSRSLIGAVCSARPQPAR